MVKYSFQGKEAVITGAAVGIGYEIASQLLLAGASVILNDIDKSLADQAANKISATGGGGQCIAVEGDAGEVQTVEKMIALARAFWHAGFRNCKRWYYEIRFFFKLLGRRF